MEIAPDGLDGILITHEHCDHVEALARFVARHPTVVYANEGTAAVVERQIRLAQRAVPEFALFESQIPFVLGDLVVTPIRVSHDTAEPVSYTLDDGVSRLGYFTDLGFVSPAVSAAMSDCTALVLESNHDVEMLRASGRAYSVIARIQGNSGHLSNEQACAALAEADPARLRALVLAHLSHECNDAAVARAMMQRTVRTLGREDLVGQIHVAEQGAPLPFLEA